MSIDKISAPNSKFYGGHPTKTEKYHLLQNLTIHVPSYCSNGQWCQYEFRIRSADFIEKIAAELTSTDANS